MLNVVSFSGGKDSTALLLMMLEKGIRVDRVIFIDTTKEFPQTYENIDRVQEMIKPLKIEKFKIDFDYWFGEHIKTKGKYKGEKGYGWPGVNSRWCTGLKMATFNKAVRGEEVVEFIGIAYDERERVVHNRQYSKNRNVKYPLVEWGVREREALEYCYSKGLDWGGLYKKFNRVSCWCCPFQRIGALRTLFNDFPNLWQELREMDKKSGRKFRLNYSVDDLTGMFLKENLKR